MRIALLTDIHENFVMLEKAHAALQKHGYDLLVCLGDITGFSPLFYSHTPDAAACVDLLRMNAHIVVAGNHDLYTCRRLPFYHSEHKIPNNWHELTYVQQVGISRNKFWLYEDEQIPPLNKDQKTYLAGLKEFEIFDTGKENIIFTHFFSPDMSGICRWFPSNNFEIRAHFTFMKKHNCSLAFTGHSHPAGPVLVNRFLWHSAGYLPAAIKNGHRAVICPSITGERNPGCAIIFDTTKKHLIPVLIQ